MINYQKNIILVYSLSTDKFIFNFIGILMIISNSNQLVEYKQPEDIRQLECAQ